MCSVLNYLPKMQVLGIFHLTCSGVQENYFSSVLKSADKCPNLGFVQHHYL